MRYLRRFVGEGRLEGTNGKRFDYGRYVNGPNYIAILAEMFCRSPSQVTSGSRRVRRGYENNVRALLEDSARGFGDNEHYRDEYGASLDLAPSSDANGDNVSRNRMASDTHVRRGLLGLFIKRVVCFLGDRGRSQGSTYKANNE